MLNASYAGPHFIIAGFPKCGTTSLFYGLQKYPGIHLANGEPNYFVKAAHSAAEQHDYLRSLGPDAALRGEKSPGYLERPESFANIARALPAIKLVICLRHPTDMLISFFNFRLSCYEAMRGCDLGLRGAMQRRFPVAVPSFEDVVLRGVNVFGASLESTRFASKLQAARLEQLFQPTQLQFILLEEMALYPEYQWVVLGRFLGLDGARLAQYVLETGSLNANAAANRSTPTGAVVYDQLSEITRAALARAHRIEIPALIALSVIPVNTKAAIRALWNASR